MNTGLGVDGSTAALKHVVSVQKGCGGKAVYALYCAPLISTMCTKSKIEYIILNLSTCAAL